jgi:hypothetical protein
MTKKLITWQVVLLWLLLTPFARAQSNTDLVDITPACVGVNNGAVSLKPSEVLSQLGISNYSGGFVANYIVNGNPVAAGACGTPSITGLAAGASVVVTVLLDADNDCIADPGELSATGSQFFVPVQNSQTINVLAADTILCATTATGNISVELSGPLTASQYRFIWYQGANIIDQQISFDGKSSVSGLALNNTYRVEVFAQGTATANAPFDVVNNTCLVAARSFAVVLTNITPSAEIKPSCNLGDNGAIRVSATGGQEPYVFSLVRQSTGVPQSALPFPNTNLFAGLVPDVYELVVTDANGCSSAVQLLTVGSAANPQTVNFAGSINPTCANFQDGQILVTPQASGNYLIRIFRGTSVVPIDNTPEFNTYLYRTDVNVALSANQPHSFTNLPSGQYAFAFYPQPAGSATQPNFSDCVTVLEDPFDFSSSDELVAPQPISVFGTVVNADCPNAPVASGAITDVEFFGGSFDPFNLAPDFVYTLLRKTGPNPGDLVATNYTNVEINAGADPFTLGNLAPGEYILRVKSELCVVVQDFSFVIQTNNLVTDYSVNAVAVSCSNENSNNPVALNGDGRISVTFLNPAASAGTFLDLIREVVSGSTVTEVPVSLDIPVNTNGQNLFVNLVPGEYVVRHETAAGCELSRKVVVVQEPQPVGIQAPVVKQLSCGTLNDASISVTAFPANAPLVYQWVDVSNGIDPIPVTAQNNANTATLTNISAGTYRVRVFRVIDPLNPTSQSANCWFESGNIEVFPPAQPLAIDYSLTSEISELCFNDQSGRIDIPAAALSGGTTPYTYQWFSNGVLLPGKTSRSLINVGAGNYSLRVKDANGCEQEFIGNSANQAQDFALIPRQELILSITNQINPSSCLAGQNNGSISVAITGGTGVKTLRISSSNTPQVNVGVFTFTNLSAGTFIITVEDENGCTDAETVVLQSPSANPIVVSANPVNALCFNGTGSAAITVNGGSGTYSYRVNNGTAMPVPGAGLSLANLAAGTYAVEITDNQGCVGQTSFAITQPNQIAIAPSSVSVTNVSCFGNSDGAIAAVLQGGVAPYNWQLTNNAGLPSQSGSFAGGGSINFTNLQGSFTGIGYSLNVVDANGCSMNFPLFATVTSPNAPVAVTLLGTPVNVTCNGVANGSFEFVATGGTTPYSYTLVGPVNRGPQPNGAFNNLPAGSYTVTVTDAKSCTSTASVMVTEPNAVVISQVNGVASTQCGVGNGQITVAATGPGALQYTLRRVTNAIGNVPFFDPTSGNPVVIGPTANPTFVTLPANSFWKVEVNPVSNPSCVTTHGSIIEIQDLAPRLVIGSLAIESVACAGSATGSADINGVVTEQNGTLQNTYSIRWFRQGDPVAFLQASRVAQNLTSGLYRVEVVHPASGCVTVKEFEVPLMPLGIQSLEVTPVTCTGSKTGKISFTIQNGKPIYSVLIRQSLNGIPTGPVITKQTANLDFESDGLGAGFYQVQLVDGNGCSITFPNEISIGEPQPLAASSTKQDVICFGENTGSISVSVTGGTAPYSYVWQKLIAGSYQTIPGVVSSSFANANAGFYRATVMDANGCMISLDVLVNQPGSELTAQLAITNVSCFGGNNGAATITVFGGNAPYSVTWFRNGSEIPGTANQLTISNLMASSPTNEYSVRFVDNGGCVRERVVNISQPSAQLDLQAAVQKATCSGQTANGAFTLTASGGVQPYEFQYRETGSPGFISSGQVLTNIWKFSNLAGNKSYDVRVRDANGCEALLGNQLLENNLLGATISQLKNPQCGNDGSAVATIQGGQAPFTVQINGQPVAIASTATAFELMNLASNNQTVIVTDDLGCVFSTSFFLQAPAFPKPVVSVAVVGEVCPGANAGKATVSVAPGTGSGNLNFTWTFENGTVVADGKDATSLINLAPGSYQLNTTDLATGCVQTQTVIIPISFATPLQLTSQLQNPTCNSTSTGSISGVISGGVAPFTIKLLTGGVETGMVQSASGLFVFNALAAGTYSIVASDANGCARTFNGLELLNPPVLAITSNSEFIVSSCQIMSIPTSAFPLTTTYPVSAYTATYFEVGNDQVSVSQLMVGKNYRLVVALNTAGDCKVESVVAVKHPSPFTAVLSASSNPLCSGGQGSFTVTANPVGSYTYEIISGGTGSSTDGTFSTMAGQYVVAVTDGNGCSSTVSVNLVAPAALTLANAEVVNPSCTDANVLGSIALNVAGGTGSYTYAWTGVEQSLATLPMQSNLTDGTYTVVVTDANGCTVSGLYAIARPAVFDIETMVIGVGCLGNLAGEVKVELSSTAAPFAYRLTRPNSTEVIQGLSNTSSFVLSVSVAATYTLEVVNANGCLISQEVSVSSSNLSAKPAITVSDKLICAGEIVTLSVVNSPEFVSYLWSSGETTPTITVSPTATTSYFVTVVTLACGSIVSVPDTVIVQAAPAVPAVIRNQTSNTLIANTGSASDIVAYQWFVASNQDCQLTEIAGATQSVLSFTESGYYVVEVKNQNGCVSRSVCGTLFVPGTSVSEGLVLANVSIYPNPTQGEFAISASWDLTTPVSVELYDAVGKLVLVQSFKPTATGQAFTLNQELAQGLYTLKIASGNQIWTGKLVRN